MFNIDFNREKAITCHDKLMEDEDYRKGFEKEYAELCISAEIAKARHDAKLKRASLAKKIKSTKSAVSRYESGQYDRYSIPLLRRIVSACGARLEIKFVPNNA